MPPRYKPKSELRTRRSAGEPDAPGDAKWEHAATALDRPLVDVEALKQAQQIERVERVRRDAEREGSRRRALLVWGAVVIGLALAAGAGFGAYLALTP